MLQTVFFFLCLHFIEYKYRLSCKMHNKQKQYSQTFLTDWFFFLSFFLPSFSINGGWKCEGTWDDMEDVIFTIFDFYSSHRDCTDISCNLYVKTHKWHWILSLCTTVSLVWSYPLRQATQWSSSSFFPFSVFSSCNETSIDDAVGESDIFRYLSA